MKFTLLASSILAAACALASPIIEARDKHVRSLTTLRTRDAADTPRRYS